jgi:hypothetical protein
MSNVFVVTRTSDANGVEEYETLAAFSTYEKANEQARVLKQIYNVEIHELEVDLSVLVPQDIGLTVANG